MLIWILVDVQYLQNIVFSIEEFWIVEIAPRQIPTTR